MLTFINEKSFPEHVQSEEELVGVLEQIVLMAPFAQHLSNNQPIRRHRELHDRLVFEGKTLCEFIACIGQHQNRKYADRSAVFLRMFSRGPFVTSRHVNANESVVNESGKCLKNSSFDEATSCPAGAAMLSFTNEDDPVESFTVSSSVYGKMKILNFISRDEIAKSCWVYEANPKHELKEDKLVGGKLHSTMDLDNPTAQRTLTNGVMVGKSVYGYQGKKWYKFHCHENNKFHGFPIPDNTNHQDFSTAKKILNAVLPNEFGQIISD